ncbi:MAG: phage terminase large subunit family protein [Deltaproteobacteria bacterium]|nr:phage terminase large subunit family protein [Deltaproteobacteria bacterium]
MKNDALVFELWPIEKNILKPPESILMSGWANKNVNLLKAIDRISGPYRWQVAPYQRDILDLFQHPDINHIVLKWATQTGKTLIEYIICSWIIDQNPYSTLLAYANDGQAREISRTRLQRMFEECEPVKKKIPSNPSKYQLQEMSFPGMVLYLIGCNSPVSTSQKPCKNLIRDEVNKWPALIGEYGDPMELTEERLKSFWDIRKIVDVSSPTTEDGNITIQESLCQAIIRYCVPCPHCGRLQDYNWDQIKYEDRKDLKKNDRIYVARSTAHYECKFCKKDIDDMQRDWVLNPSNGAGWFDIINEEPEPSENSIGDIFKFYAESGIKLQSVASRLSSIYSPLLKFGDLVEKYLKAELSEVDRFDNKRTFITDWLGEEYVPKVEAQSEDMILTHRCELPPLIVHPDAVALTLGGDVHKTHIEFVIRAWARDYRNWLIRYGALYSWDELLQIIFEDEYPIEGTEETIKIWRAGIDTGGSESGEEDKTATEEVYAWLRDHGQGVAFGVKGSSAKMSTRVRQTIIDKMPGRKGKPIPGGLIVWIIDTAEFKETIHYRLGIEDEGPQYFYLNSETGQDYARQITAEEKRYEKGKLIWHKKRANHYLDCEVYAAACADPQWWGGIRILKGRAKPRKSAPKPKASKGGRSWIPRSGGSWIPR